MWSTAVTILHILSCVFLVVVVLLQTGKGTDVNAVFGGSSQTIFGSSGAGNFLTKLTTATAAVFMATSLFLTYGIAKQTSKSIFDEAPTPPAATPATPEQTPATSGGTPSDKPAEAPATSQTAPATTPPPPTPSPLSAAPAPSATVSVIPTEAPKPPTTAAPADVTKTPTAETKSAENTAKTPAPQAVPAAPK
jgi:preprotein translocase subunit SecG